MGDKTGIEWTDHTFNPWWGCMKVSPECENCYALTFSRRLGFDIWGPEKTTRRRVFGDDHWNAPLKWNRDAEKAGVRARVFCASMADVFEDHAHITHERYRLWKLIRATPWLDWQLLTKRPENVAGMLPADWGTGYENVWLGTSVGREDYLCRVSTLLEVPARVRFLSCEPLLGPLDLTPFFASTDGFVYHGDETGPVHVDDGARSIDWVIVGGESGPKSRPMHPDWARTIRDQCVENGVPFLFKQWGEWVTEEQAPQDIVLPGESTAFFGDAGPAMYRVGKKRAGRELDGRTWDEFPTTEPLAVGDPTRGS